MLPALPRTPATRGSSTYDPGDTGKVQRIGRCIMSLVYGARPDTSERNSPIGAMPACRRRGGRESGFGGEAPASLLLRRRSSAILAAAISLVAFGAAESAQGKHVIRFPCAGRRMRAEGVG